MSKNKFIGDKEKLSIVEEGIKADLSFFNDFNYFLGECIAIASLLGKYQFYHGVDLNNGFLVEDDLESFKRENNKAIAFIKEVITNNNLTNAYDQRIADADNKIANIINEMIFKEGGIAHVNGLDNVYFSTECNDKASEYFACVYPTAAGSIPPDNRMTLDDYLKMEDLMPPNLKAAINQPKVNLENQQKLLQNLLNTAALTPEQREQLNKQLSNISATLDNPVLKAIDLIYRNATWGKQLISERYQKYGDLYFVIDVLWNAASLGIGLFTYGIGTTVMAGIDLFSAGYQYNMLNTTGRNLVTGEIATSAEYKAATFNLIAEGVSLGVGHLNNKINPAGKSIANQLSETKLGQRLMSSEAYRVYTHAKDQLGVAVKPVVGKIQQTIDDIKLGITKPIVGGLDKVEDYFGDVAKRVSDLNYNLNIQKSAQFNAKIETKITAKPLLNNEGQLVPNRINPPYFEGQKQKFSKNGKYYVDLSDTDFKSLNTSYDDKIKIYCNQDTNYSLIKFNRRRAVKLLEETGFIPTLGELGVDLKYLNNKGNKFFLLKGSNQIEFSFKGEKIEGISTIFCVDDNNKINQILICNNGFRLLDIDFHNSPHWHVWPRHIDFIEGHIYVQIERNKNHYFGSLDLSKFFKGEYHE